MNQATEQATEQSAIYREHADRYHELVSAEDCDGNLRRALGRIVALDGADVIEIGAGTGRVTQLLLDAGARVLATEPEQAMIDVAQKTLRPPRPELLTIRRAAASALPAADASADVAVAAWVFGHLRKWLPEGWREAVGEAFAELRRVLRPGGRIIVIETLGTGRTTPAPPGPDLAEYYAWLEDERGGGLTREAIRTDYAFPDADTAARVLGFFFGDSMTERVRTHGWARVPECTGIWAG